MKKVIIAIDSFKGSLSSFEAGESAAKGIKRIFPECEVISIPVSDGGEGLTDVLIAATSGKKVVLQAHDPLMNLRQTYYGISGDGKTAFIEMANISGLTLVPLEQRNPMLTTTYGTGEVIKDALEHGCRNFIIGIGGSATNDAGMGMLQALGYKLKDKDGRVLDIANGQTMSQVASIEGDDRCPAILASHFTVACDVNNPFFGAQGAAAIFAPQKGADKEMVNILDMGMRRIATVIRQTTGIDISEIPGSGAAGGMGGCLRAFFNAELKPGIELVLKVLDFSNRISDADLVITGEGKADKQTVMGKVAHGILKEADKWNVPVVLLAGSIEDSEILNEAGFTAVFSITPAPMPLKQAMHADVTRRNIERTAEQIARIIQIQAKL